jgi:hypothetical protein
MVTTHVTEQQFASGIGIPHIEQLDINRSSFPHQCHRDVTDR